MDYTNTPKTYNPIFRNKKSTRCSLNLGNIRYEPWEQEWQDYDYHLQRNPHLDINAFLQGEINQNEDGVLCMFDETTPVKACSDFNYHFSDIGGNMIKGSEECRESLQLKRRRMLQFNSNMTDPCICNEQTLSTYVESKDWENPMEDTVPENVQYVTSFSGIFLLMKAWISHQRDFLQLALMTTRCITTVMKFIGKHITYGSSIPTFMLQNNDCNRNVAEASFDQVEISDISTIQPVTQTGMIQEPHPASRSIFKVISGRESFMQTPTKLAASVAYPFALIKPCGVQDVTLKDINQRIRTPPVIISKQKEKERASSSYPTSAFSGKPVVVKTRIRTEGGKGSITIMRTKG